MHPCRYLLVLYGMLQNWLSSCLKRILLGSKEFSQVGYVEANSLSAYHDVFRAVLAAYGGSPPDNVIDAVVDCARRRSTLPRRRRRRHTWSVSGWQHQRRVALQRRWLPRSSPGDGENIRHPHAHRHRRRSVDDNDCGTILTLSLI